MDKEFIKYLDKKFDNIDERFNSVEGEIKEKFDKVLDGQDRIFKRLDSLEQENQISTNLYKGHDKKIENHEKRIFSLEGKP